MPQPRAPFPKALRERAFDVAEARQHEIRADVLKHPRFDRPFRGVRRLTSVDGTPATASERVLQRTGDFLPILQKNGGSFSHTTALLLLGCPIRCDESLHVTVLSTQQPPRRQGVLGHRTSEAHTVWSDSSGRNIVPPILALLQSAAILPFTELVVAIDHLIHVARTGADEPVVTLEDVLDAAMAYSGRGARRLIAALRIARPGADSRMETLLRLIMAQYGLDVLELQANVYDTEGQWIGRFDMVDRERKLIVEYDGEQHRSDRAQYLKDQRRLDAARAAGYQILRLHREDVLDRRQETARRVADFLGMPLRPISGALRRFFAER